MKKVRFKIGASWYFAGAKMEEEIELFVPDTWTNEQIEEYARIRAYEYYAQFLDAWCEKIDLRGL